jgi:hypothetical protein
MPLALSLIALVQPASLQPRITENVSMLCAPRSTDKIADHLHMRALEATLIVLMVVRCRSIFLTGSVYTSTYQRIA